MKVQIDNLAFELPADLSRRAKELLPKLIFSKEEFIIRALKGWISLYEQVIEAQKEPGPLIPYTFGELKEKYNLED